MPTTTVEREMIALEQQYWQAMKEDNLQAALNLTADPCVVAGPSGVASIDREAFSQMMEGAEWKLHDFKLGDDVLVRSLGDDTRLVAYTVHEDMTVEGKRLTLDAAEASVWKKQGGHWKCALHTESLLGDSFGRDRKSK